MSDMLSIGVSGVRAYQSALTTTSENIANAGAPGYTRRTSALAEVAATTGNARLPAGQGVVVTGVTRAGDDLRSAAVRDAGADLAKTQTSATWLERVETALSGNQLSDQLTAFFNSAKSVAADPTALAPRTAMLESASSVASAFSATGKALDAAAADLDATTEAAVTQLNQLAAGLAKVNSGLGRISPGTAGQAALLDERDRLLEAMSAITDVTASFDASGRTTLRAGGSDGPLLVQGDEAGIVTFVRNEEGAASLAVHRSATTKALTPGGGALAGLIEGAQRIAAAQTEVNAIAADFVAGVNEIQAAGDDLSGGEGAAMFATGEPASQVSLILSDPRGIAAASRGGGGRDNANLAAFETLRSDSRVENRVTDAVATNAAALTARRTVADAQTAIRDSAVAAREAVSGVNIDEEAVDLIRFQQAYQASSRVIQVARETLQSILEIR